MIKYGVTTHIKRDEMGDFLRPAHPQGGDASILLYIEWWYSSLTCSCPLVPLPAIPPNNTWLRRSPTEIFSPPPPLHRSVVGLPGGSSTSAAPLDRGNGGRHQAVRVTGHGGVAGLRRISSRS